MLPIAKADTGASFHLLKPEDRKMMSDITELTNGLAATLPNNEIIQASYQGVLPLESLSK